jgi:uncharacterized protein (DUF488 family)
MEARVLYTIGHSTRTADELIDVLLAARVVRLVDVRTVPRSRTNPQFNADALPATLADVGLDYVRMPALGGLRARVKGSDPATNAGWEKAAFHNYADHALTPAFRLALDELLALAAAETCAIMCAEAVWWRCHRRIITDHVLAHGVPVMHLFTPTKHEPASLTPFAVVHVDQTVTYPASAA